MCSVSICVEDIASTWTKPPMSAQRFQRCHSIAKLTYGASAWIDFTRASERQRIEAFIRHCVRSELCSVNTKTFAEMCDTYDYRLFNSTISHVICIISTNYFTQSPQLQKTIILDHANTIGCSHNALRVSSTLILFIELFILTFINFLRGICFYYCCVAVYQHFT